MKSFMKHYKFESSIIIFELLFQNLLLLGSTLITMYMAKLVMEGDLRGILICSAGIMILYLILHLLFWSYDVHLTKVIAKINQAMRENLNHQMLKKASHMEGAFLGILILGLGIAVSLGEFFCTGQIYMASILYLLRNAREQWLSLLGTLMVYVTAMSIPAVVILAVIARTKGTGRVSDFMLKHMGAIKLLNCLLFLFYAAYFLLK